MTTVCQIPAEVRAIFSSRAELRSQQVFGFVVESELDDLLDVIERIEVRRPELFRETERCRDLLDRLHGLVDARHNAVLG